MTETNYATVTLVKVVGNRRYALTLEEERGDLESLIDENSLNIKLTKKMKERVRLWENYIQDLEDCENKKGE